MIKPLGERIVVKVKEKDMTTASGIVLPDTAKEKPQEGEVVAVGTGKMLECGKVAPMEVKKGDRVLFAKYSGNEVKVDDEEYLQVLRPLLQGKRRQLKAMSEYEANGRLIRFALGKGFTFDIIRQCLDTEGHETEEDDD